MQLEKDQTALSPEPAENTQDKDTEWLLEQDMSEPEENLFTVDNDDDIDTALSAYETEIAGRPMFRGHGQGDDLSSMVEEEIVVTDVGGGNDIYASSASSSAMSAKSDTPRTVDHSSARRSTNQGLTTEVVDGADILSLTDDDDMGDHNLVLMSSKPESKIESVAERASNLTTETVVDMALELEVVEEVPVTLDLDTELDLSAHVDSSVDLELSPEMVDASGFDLGSELEFDDELDLTQDFNNDSELEFSGLEIDDALDEEIDFDLGSGFNEASTNIPEMEFEEELDLSVDLGTADSVMTDAIENADASDMILEEMLEQSSELQAEDELKLEIELELQAEEEQVEVELELQTEDEEADVELELQTEDEEADVELVLGQQAEDSQEIESVLEYISHVPAPSDEDEFDSYLLGGQELEGANAESDVLEVAHTDGMSSVDTDVDVSIDYHEDFHSIDGFDDNAASDFTGVIAQVMEEVTTAVHQRLQVLEIESEKIQVEAMLGSDIASIIECVNDGFTPIVDIRSDLPAVLRQLGQSQVDAIYVRISHPDITGNWNNLFDENFIPPGSESEHTLKEVTEDAAPQPFEAFDLDEFNFEESEEPLGEILSTQDFGDDLDPYAELSSDDPLASIDFAALDDSDSDSSDYQPYAGTSAKAVEEEAGNTAREEDVSKGDLSAESDLSWCLPEGIKFTSSNRGSAELFVEFLDVFFEEGASELEHLEDSIGGWEAGGSDAVPDTVTHTLHTLKGIAKGVGLHCFGTLIHNYETLLERLSLHSTDQGRVGYFRIVNAWLDAVVKGFESIEATRSDISSELPVGASSGEEQSKDEQSLELEVSADTEQESKATETGKKVSQIVTASEVKPQFTLESDKQLADQGAQALGAKQSIRMTSEALDNLLNLTNQAQQLGVRSSENTVRSKRAASESLARLSAVRAHIVKIADRALSNVSSKEKHSASELDALEMDQYSELQEAANILRESVEDLDDLIRDSSRHVSTAEALLKQQSSVISSLGSSIQAVRVVPVARLFPGLRRIVRTVAADLGKDVSFKVLKQVGTLDRDNHARCQVILEHMVRNAMDHGIESPEQREAQGKPVSGTISVDVNKRGADYIITLADDGKGVDPALMRETAYQKGLDIDVDALTDEEAVRLIFHKGFSTASTVSEISGRGVGMDIVLSELQQIGGDVEIESIVGEGTKFHIRIPPNVSVNGALLVSAGERSYAIPLDGLIAVDYVHVDSFFDAVAEDKTLSLFGVDCEPAYLGTLCNGESLPERSAWPNSVPVLIAGSEGRHMAIAVDDVKQALELVIRSLGVQFSGVPGVAGATTTADGQAVVALDLNALVKGAGLEEMTPLSVEQEVTEQALVLVVDDSRTQRMVSTSQFDTIGVETITAENGMVAIDLLNTTQRLPDVILLDVEMPVKDGIQTLREIRKSTRYSDIPVIMVTSRTGAKHRALADEAGCDGYMGKPFNFPVLVEQINQLTGHNLQID